MSSAWLPWPTVTMIKHLLPPPTTLIIVISICFLIFIFYFIFWLFKMLLLEMFCVKINKNCNRPLHYVPIPGFVIFKFTFNSSYNTILPFYHSVPFIYNLRPALGFHSYLHSVIFRWNQTRNSFVYDMDGVDSNWIPNTSQQVKNISY